MYNLVLCAIFKNEAHILDEWLTHYFNRGVEHIYLVNDGSTDEYQKIIDSFPNVTLFHNELTDKKAGRQVNICNEYFSSIFPLSKWVMVLDLDEFMYSPVEKEISSVLDQYSEYSQIRVDWLHFGSNGHIDQPSSVVEGFTKRAN